MKPEKPKRTRSPKGGVAIPLPPDLIEFNNSAIVTPKPPMEFERERESYINDLKKSKGIE